MTTSAHIPPPAPSTTKTTYREEVEAIKEVRALIGRLQLIRITRDRLSRVHQAQQSHR